MASVQLRLWQCASVIVISVGSLWSATQWIASSLLYRSELAYRSELGDPVFSLSSYPVYAPWKLFHWWFVFGDEAPDLFRKAGSLAMGGSLLACLVSLGISLWQIKSRSRITTYGSARWAEEADVQKAGLYARSGVFLGMRNGFYLRHNGPEHVLAFAPTRSGKGVGLVVPTLLSWTGSVLVHDLKGENWQLTSGWRARFSRCVMFNPADPDSARYNPLLEVRKGTHEVRDVQNIADILVDPEGAQEHRTHWDKTAHALLVGVILHVLYAEEEKTLSKVAFLLSDPAQSIFKLLREMMSANHLGDESTPKVHPVVASAARELLNKSENERSGVLSTALSFLSLYRDPVIAANTSCSDWRIADLMREGKPLSLYLVIPPSDLSRTRPLVRLMLNQTGRRLTERLQEVRPEPDTRPGTQPGAQGLLLMLDEFPALGRLEFFETSLAFMAGYGIRAFMIAQSLNQIVKAYGEHHSILDNAHIRIAFAANDERTARRISDSLGTATELRAQKNYSGHRLAPWLSHMTLSSQETSRPLLTPGEVMQLPEEEELILLSGQPPIRAQKFRYYEDRNFLKRLLPAPCKTGRRDNPLPCSDHDWQEQFCAQHPSLEQQEEIQTSLSEGSIGDQESFSGEPSVPKRPSQKSRDQKRRSSQNRSVQLELSLLQDDF